MLQLATGLLCNNNNRTLQEQAIDTGVSMPNHENLVRLDGSRDTSSTQLLPNDISDEHVTGALQAVNEQLLLAGLRERASADELRNQLAFTSAVTRSLSEGVFALDSAGVITLVNLAAELMLGWTEAELIGKQINEIVPLHTQPGAQPVWEQSFVHKIIDTEASYQDVDVVITRRDGSTFPAIYSAAPIVINNLVAGVVISFRDMTEMQRLRQIQQAYISLLSQQQAVLEKQVQERTSELEQTNVALQAQIGERKRSEQARQHLLGQLVSAQEEERRRIARELHDQMGQSVTALMFAIRVLQDRADSTPEVQQRLADLYGLGNQIGQDVRTLAVQLRPPALDDFGLVPTLTTYVEQWSAQAMVTVDFYSTGLENVRLPPLVETTVFRFVQEALTNIMRHAAATRVSVIMHRRADTLQVIVEDNGVGFDTKQERERPYAERRFGLLGIEERVTQLAGVLTIESTLGSGTTVFVSLPLAHIS